jgi:hypothetical protein
VPTTSEILAEREGTHGPFPNQARCAQAFKYVLREWARDQRIDAVKVEALESILLKISRILNGNPNEVDHWHDIAGYATLIAQGLQCHKS